MANRTILFFLSCAPATARASGSLLSRAQIVAKLFAKRQEDSVNCKLLILSNKVKCFVDPSFFNMFKRKGGHKKPTLYMDVQS